MKKQLLLALFVCINFACKAQDFAKVLEKTVVSFDTTTDQSKKLEYSNKLGLIAKKFNKEWLGSYYAAYSKVQLSYQEKDGEKKDALLDQAQELINEAIATLGKNNDETYVVNAMIANSRISVSPMQRWKQYGAVFQENLDKAKEINPDNPRIYLLQGITKYYTPTPFGGGKKAATPYFEKAKTLFAKQESGDITKPYWGARTNEYFIALANGTIKEEMQD